jgi:hypothetical protein
MMRGPRKFSLLAYIELCVFVWLKSRPLVEEIGSHFGKDRGYCHIYLKLTRVVGYFRCALETILILGWMIVNALEKFLP